MKTNLAFLVILSSLSFAASAGRVEFGYHFDNPTVKNIGEYQTLVFANSLLSSLPGQPALPYQQVKLMLPPGESAKSIEITFSDETELAGKFSLYPQQEVRPVGNAVPVKIIKDEAVYNLNATYPANPQGHLITSFLNGRAFALSTFTPLRYNPVTGKASYYSSVKVIVETETDINAQNALSNLSVDSKLAARFADNPEMDNLYSSMRRPLTDIYEILIVCTSGYSSAFEGMRAAYLKEGLRSQVVTFETIKSSMTGTDDPERIRNFIIKEYKAHGIQQVVLAGDAELIPYRGFYAYVQSGLGYTDYNIPSDVYYSALDSTWDTDNDAIWGEPGEEDLLPDISVGRLPFSNPTELNALLHKSYNYQFAPVDGEFRNILLAGEYLYPAPYLTYGSYYMKLLVGLRTNYGYTTSGIPVTYPIDTLYDDETSSWSKQTLINHLNMGRPMLNHVGHANETYVMRLGNGDITNSNFSGLNGVTHNYTIVYTHGCDCGAFDNNTSDCIGERMVNIDNFAAAFIGNSRYGWFNEGTGDGPSEHLHREFMDALFHDKINRLGSAHLQSKIATSPWVTAPGQWETGALRWCFYDCNVLGDPAMAAFTDNPIIIKTVYPDNVLLGTTTLPVLVTSEGSAVEGLSCVVIENGAMIGKATTDASGNCTIALSPAIIEPGNVQLVVSGYNCVPATYNLVAKTYSWNASSGNWKTASNWTPSRLDPAANDILVFDGSLQATPSVSPDFTTAENTGRIRLVNNVSLTIASASAPCKIIAGASGSAGPQFEIASGSTLNVNASNPLSINIPSGSVASISGNVVFQSAAHRFTAEGAGGITFNSGSSFTAGSSFTGNAFGTGIPGSVVFANGSTYTQNGGSHPFGLTAPGSVVSFATGSLYKFTASSGAPDLSGRTYGKIEVNSSSTALNSISGAGSLTLYDLTLTGGTCGFNITGSIHLKGNISLASGTALSFNPASAATLYLDGTSPQQISGTGSLNCNSNSSAEIANTSGVTLTNATTFNNLAISPGTFTVASGASLITTGSVSGTARVERNIANDNAWHFLSSPVSSQEVQPSFAPTVMNGSFDFYAWDPTQSLISGQPWLNLRNETGGLNTGFDPLYPSAPRFKTGSGYLVAYSSGYTNPTFDGAVKAFNGTLHSGALAVPVLNAANSWNLIGNPYASSLDFDKFSDAAGSALTTPAYWTVLADGSFASYLKGSGGINGATQHIAPMQGFFAEVTTSTNVNFTNAMREHSSQAWLKDSPVIPDQLRLQVTSSDGSSRDEVLIHKSVYFDGSTGAEKILSMGNEPANLFTVKSGKKFGIDQLNAPAESLVLGFIPSTASNYILTVALNTFPSTSKITLEDLKTAKIQDLQKDPAYSFTAATDDDINRFVLHFKSTDGIPKGENSTGIHVYSDGKILYINQPTFQNGSVSVYNAAGQLVETKTLAPLLTQSVQLDLPAGIYLVSVSSGKVVYKEKIVLR